MKLETLQRSIKQWIIGPTLSSQDLLCVRDALGGPHLDAGKQIGIYRTQYIRRHINSLREDFETGEALLGEAKFRALAEEYVRTFPPTHDLLGEFGERFPDFLRTKGVEAVVEDAALLDNAVRVSFEAADHSPVAASVLAGVAEDAWTSARLEIAPSLRLLQLRSHVYLVRQAVRAGEAPVHPKAENVAVVVTRQTGGVEFFVLDPIAARLLSKVIAGQPLGAACEETVAETGAPFDVAPYFTDWVRLGWIVDVIVS